MLISWMAYATLFGFFVYGAATAVDRAVAAWDRGRRAIWAAALVVAVAGPATLALWPTSRAATATIQKTLNALPTDVTERGTAPVTRDESAPSVIARAERFIARIDPYAERAWLLASVACLALLLRAAIAVRRQRAHWTGVEMDGVAVFVAPHVGPAVVGAIRPQVVVPRWAFALDAPVRDLMLRHEIEHIRARDPLVLVGALLTTAAFPWNAALWAIVRRLRLAIEIDCDRRVLHASNRHREYGELLLTVSAHRSAPLPFATSLAERRPFLERRIRAMTPTIPRYPRLISAVCVALAVVATTAAVRAPRPAPLVRPQRIISGRQAPGRGPDSLSVAELRALIGLHQASALSRTPDVKVSVIMVVDADGAYVASAADARPIPAGEGRGGRAGGDPASNVLPGGFGRARGNSGAGTPANTSGNLPPGARMTQRSTETREGWITANGSAGVITREKSLVAIAGDTMQLTARQWTDAAPDSEVVFVMVNIQMRASALIDLNTSRLARLVRSERVESISGRSFEAGELGLAPLDVFIVRLKP